MAARDGQKIRQLMPLARALSLLDGLARSVSPLRVDAGDAVGRALAADVVSTALPRRATALRDGWAVKADELTDAGGYAPVRLRSVPSRVETGDEMPAGTDAVAPVETIVMRGNTAEAVSAVTVGEGVMPAGSESDPSRPLRKAGERVRITDAAVFAATGIAEVSVRVPRLLVVATREDLRLMPAVQMIARDGTARGAVAVLQNGIDLDEAVHRDDCDAIIVVGGSGSGTRDNSVETLAKRGKVAVHGVGLTPGETVAFGQVGARPVLIVPGRLDAALAAWLVLGRRLLARLAGDDDVQPIVMLALSRKVTSTVGLAEVVPIRREQNKAEPLASVSLPLWALTRADGWLLVPPDSEGYPAGAEVAVNPWPGTWPGTWL